MLIRKEIDLETEAVKLQGQTQFRSWEVIVPASTGVHETTIVFPYDINLIRGKWFNKAAFEGDSVQFVVGEDTVIGAITSNVTTGDTVINVSSTVIDNTKLGFELRCEGQDWGRVIGIDEGAGTITIENAATANITATGSEYILQSVYFVPHIYLDGTETMMSLEGGVGSSYLPANTTMKIKYNNISGTSKTYSVILEYHY